MYYDRIAHFADIDTRRAMGYPPRKLDPSWKEFQPRGFENELFVYYPEEEKLVYYEFGKYNFCYYETITHIKPHHHGSHEWIIKGDSRTRGTVHCDESSETYDVETNRQFLFTAGWPVFVIKKPTPD